MNFFDDLPLSSYFPDFLHGAEVTLVLTMVSYVLAVVAGCATALARYHRQNKLVYIPATIFVEGTRNVPSLVLLYLVYFGLPQFGIQLSSTFAGVLVLVWTTAPYLGEALRGGLEAIPQGHWEASRALGLTGWQTARRVALPQMVTNSWPLLVSYWMLTLFGTTLLSVIDVGELTQVASQVNSETFRSFEVYTYLFIIYYAMSTAAQFIFTRVHPLVDRERRALRKGRR